MPPIVHVFANFLVPTALVIVFVWAYFRPPAWHLDDKRIRREAYVDSQRSIAKSVAGVHNAYQETRTTIVEIKGFLHGLAELREAESDRHAELAGRCEEAVVECRRMAYACERMANTIEPRRHIWSALERDRKGEGETRDGV